MTDPREKTYDLQEVYSQYDGEYDWMIDEEDEDEEGEDIDNTEYE